jgi:hypothetical protein
MSNEKILKEECPHCHAHLDLEGECPFCEEVRPSVAQESESSSPPKPEFFSVSLLRLLIR